MMQDAYIIDGKRSPVCRSKQGLLSSVRPDDMLAQVLKSLIGPYAQIQDQIDDVIIGCATPEAEQGLNIARHALLLAGLPKTVSGITINRLCCSGLQAIAYAAQQIQLGQADIIIAGGVESMSMLPLGGHQIRPSPRLFESDNSVLQGLALSMGSTAEIVAKRYNISRAAQDMFALQSHQKAVKAIAGNVFETQIVPIVSKDVVMDQSGQKIIEKHRQVASDCGPRSDTSLDALSQLKPVFSKAADASVTAGNSAQISDGAAAVVLMSEAAMQRMGCKPMLRFTAYATSGVAPEEMGMGPVAAIPKALKAAGLDLSVVDHIELNEAFAAQALAVIQEAKLDPAIINPLGGAIALGHPLGATGAIKTVMLMHHLRASSQRYGMVTMCVGGGMGACGLFESCKG